MSQQDLLTETLKVSSVMKPGISVLCLAAVLSKEGEKTEKMRNPQFADKQPS